jgi:predicted alpha-1,6-mannanase (GH76 family)
MAIAGTTSGSDRAQRAQQVLVARFWDARRRLFRVSDRLRLVRSHWHYWWQAHALDACVDAAVRTGAARDRSRVGELVGGILRRNGGQIVNDYYDDMAWMGLALLGAEQAGLVDALPLVRELWSDIVAGWDDRHGGIVWRRGDTYTNAPANGPAAILAARLHERTGAQDQLDWARRITDWLHTTLVDPETGLVWDGVHPETGEEPSRALYTYNQGTVVGADVELHRATGDEAYLRRAERTATAALSRLTDPAGLLAAEGDGDGGLFKGILTRYLGELVGALPATSALRSDLLRDLQRNGAAVATAAGPVGPDWARPEDGSGSLSTHLSAVLLLETLARLDLPPPGRNGRSPPRHERPHAERRGDLRGT